MNGTFTYLELRGYFITIRLWIFIMFCCRSLNLKITIKNIFLQDYSLTELFSFKIYLYIQKYIKQFFFHQCSTNVELLSRPSIHAHQFQWIARHPVLEVGRTGRQHPLTRPCRDVQCVALNKQSEKCNTSSKQLGLADLLTELLTK